MGHAVHYRDDDGEQRFEDVDSLEAALAFVETLRNDRDVTDVRVFRQVPIEFKTYYRVTVAGEDETPAAAAQTPLSVPDEPPAPRAGLDEPPPGSMPLVPPAAANGDAPANDDAPVNRDGEPSRRASLFNRS